MFESLRISLCPPLRGLLVQQSKAKLRRTWKRLQSPRRMIPTALVVVLMILYVIQVYIAITWGELKAPFSATAVAPLGMFGILLLKLLAVFIDREKSGAGFRAEETHQLLGGPFPRDQVRLYRVTGHAINIFFTSCFAAVFFRFHVNSFFAALSGSYLAMLFIYLVYTTVAVAAIHVTEETYKQGRNAACGVMVTLLGFCLYRASEQNASNLGFVYALADQAKWLSHTVVGGSLLGPFAVFTNVIAADNFWLWAGWTLVGVALVYAALQVLLRTELLLVSRAYRREQQLFASAGIAASEKRDDPNRLQRQLQRLARKLPWCAGAGPIVWRQLKAVTRLRGGLVWSLLPLGAAFALGGYIAFDPSEGVFQTIALVVVLTSVFLPGLLPFDFRGDLKALAALKMMPIRPRVVVLAQVAVPVVLLSGFQLFALSPLALHQRHFVYTILMTMLFLIPTNTIILALENLIFLLYPYRTSDFDMQASVRRVVMLMMKFCVLFLAALVGIVIGVGMLLVRRATSGIPLVGEVLAPFYQPLWLSTQFLVLVALAYVVVVGTGWAFQRFDLGEDIPI